MWLLCALPIFVILYAAIFGSLQRSAMFGKNAAIAVALCAALLCVLGLYETFVRPGNAGETGASREDTGFAVLLIPYAALALAILAVLLLLFVRKVLAHHDGRNPHRKTFRRKERAHDPKECGGQSTSFQDLRIPRESDAQAKLRQSNLSDNFRKRLRDQSKSKETSK
jgi:membrane protein implicated in regulation of membrane protease activity